MNIEQTVQFRVLVYCRLISICNLCDMHYNNFTSNRQFNKRNYVGICIFIERNVLYPCHQLYISGNFQHKL
jgi:hypothetical protein